MNYRKIDHKGRINGTGYTGEVCLMPTKGIDHIPAIAIMRQDYFRMGIPVFRQALREIFEDVYMGARKADRLLYAGAFPTTADRGERVTLPSYLLEYINAKKGTIVYITPGENISIISTSPGTAESKGIENMLKEESVSPEKH